MGKIVPLELDAILMMSVMAEVEPAEVGMQQSTLFNRGRVTTHLECFGAAAWRLAVLLIVRDRSPGWTKIPFKYTVSSLGLHPMLSARYDGTRTASCACEIVSSKG